MRESQTQGSRSRVFLPRCISSYCEVRRCHVCQVIPLSCWLWRKPCSALADPRRLLPFYPSEPFETSATESSWILTHSNHWTLKGLLEVTVPRNRQE